MIHVCAFRGRRLHTPANTNVIHISLRLRLPGAERDSLSYLLESACTCVFALAITPLAAAVVPLYARQQTRTRFAFTISLC